MKIATLLPSATEIIYMLGLHESLVAVSHECDFPAQAKNLPSITSSNIPENLSSQQIDQAVVEAVKEGKALYTIDGNLLNELKPDMIITQGVCDVCAVNQNTVNETLQFLPDIVDSDIQIITLSGTNFAGILRDMQTVAEATGIQQNGSRIIKACEINWNQLKGQQPVEKPKVLMLEWPDPFFYGGHWVPEMVKMAGGIDVFGKPGMESGRCTLEEIQVKDPEIIISIACGFGLEKNIEFAENLIADSQFKDLQAVRNKQVWAMDANSYCSRPTPRIIEGARKLQAIFNNEVDNIKAIKRID